jgi:hypothetical protein
VGKLLDRSCEKESFFHAASRARTKTFAKLSGPASNKSWCEKWLQAKAIEAKESTHARYERILERFTGSNASANPARDRVFSAEQPVESIRTIPLFAVAPLSATLLLDASAKIGSFLGVAPSHQKQFRLGSLPTKCRALLISNQS